jgi:hypothetical protein
MNIAATTSPPTITQVDPGTVENIVANALLVVGTANAIAVLLAGATYDDGDVGITQSPVWGFITAPPGHGPMKLGGAIVTPDVSNGESAEY